MQASKKYSFKLVTLLIALCIMLIAFVWLTAYTAKVQYEINSLNSQISETQREIKTLEVKIKQASNITNIEARALELGLVYPAFDQVKYLKAQNEPIRDLALALMETAYQE